jgi:hypothetical protein
MKNSQWAVNQVEDHGRRPEFNRPDGAPNGRGGWLHKTVHAE